MSRSSTRSGLRSMVALATTAVIGLFVVACSDRSGDLVGPPSLQRQPSAPGQDVAAAVRAQDRITPQLMGRERVVGTATGLDRSGVPVIRVFTTEPGVSGIPSHVDGVPVEVEVTGLITTVSDPTQKARPAPIGFSVGHPAITAGTIGARVRDAAGNTYILSNNHVLANINNASIGDPILQPGPFDGGTASDQIGTLTDFEPLKLNLGDPNYIDAAIAAVSAADVGTSTPADGYGTPSSTIYDLDANGDGAVDASILGLGIQKFGRTTQLTTGTLTEINVTVDVCYEVFLGIFCLRSARFEDQLGFSDISEGGDSGSLIVTVDGANTPVALLYAGSATRTLGNRIDQVLARFNVTIDGDGSPPPPPVDDPPSASFTYDCAALVCDFDASGSSDDNGIQSYDWDFGDGNTGSGVMPQHTYSSAGTRTVVLTVTDASAQTDTDSQDVTTTSTPPVDDPPTASFTYGCVDLTCDFDATGSSDDNGIVSYDWDFGDGSSASGATPQHTYASAGTRTVVLTVEDASAQQDTDSQDVTTTEPPPPPPASPTLTTRARTVKKDQHRVDLKWTAVTWAEVYVFRQIDANFPPTVIAVLPGSSTSYRDITGVSGSGVLYQHFVCEGTAGGDQCSNIAVTNY